MTKKQREQFNQMLDALRRIHKEYMTYDRIKEDDNLGLDSSEAVEMAYENIQHEAKVASAGIRRIKEDEG